MNKKIGNIFKGDKVIWMVFFFLCMISIVEVFSASSNLTYKSQNYIGPIAFHTVTIVIGALVAVVTLNIPCRYFKLMTPFLLIISGPCHLAAGRNHFPTFRDCKRHNGSDYSTDPQRHAA